MLWQKPACSHYQSYIGWISTVYVAINQPTPPWLSHKRPLLEIPATTMSKKPQRLRYQSCLTPRSPEVVRPSTRKLGERRKSIDVWINSGTRVEKTLAPPLPPALTVKPENIYSKSRVTTVTKLGTTRVTTLGPKRTYQKTSISLSDLRFDD